MRRIGLVVHPVRPIDNALGALHAWAGEHGIEVVQLEAGRMKREVAPLGEVGDCDLIAALGGDGTVLTALRASARTRSPVLGIACGSLGALSAVRADHVTEALDRLEAGDWTARRLPALALASRGAEADWAINDFVVVRRGMGQVAADLTVGDELYVRLAGDGLIIATALGSSAYTMAAGGPILAAGTPAFVCTPLAMHGGSAPPLVVPAGTTVTVEVHPGFAGFDIEIDGHTREQGEVTHVTVTLQEDHVTLVSFADMGWGLSALRGRGLITDSPRIRARDERARGQSL